jgi:hypothetical protein
MTEKTHPKDKQDLLAVIDKEWGALKSLIEKTSEEYRMIPEVQADWSVKDIMAHITAWERFGQDRIHSAKTGEPIQFPVIESDDFVNDFNAEVYKENASVPLSKVEDEFEAAHEELLETIRELDDDFLQSALPFDWAGDLTAMVFLSANTHWHYPEHGLAIRVWLTKNS